MRDQNRGLPSAEIPEPLKDLIFRASVESGGRLIQDEHLGIPHVSPRNGDLLPFAPGEIRPLLKPLAERLVIAAGQPLDDAISEAALRRLLDPAAIIGSLNMARPNILAGGELKPHEILKDHADVAPQVGQIVFAQIIAIEKDLSLRWVVEAGKKLHNRGLARPVLANESHDLSRP